MILINESTFTNIHAFVTNYTFSIPTIFLLCLLWFKLSSPKKENKSTFSIFKDSMFVVILSIGLIFFSKTFTLDENIITTPPTF